MFYQDGSRIGWQRCYRLQGDWVRRLGQYRALRIESSRGGCYHFRLEH